MYFGTQSQMKKLWEDFFTAIDRTKTLSPIEKVVEANKIGTLAKGIFKRLVTKRCK